MGALEQLFGANTTAMHALRAAAIAFAFWLLGLVGTSILRAIAVRRRGKPLEPTSAIAQSLGPLRALVVVLGLYFSRGELPREWAGGRIEQFIDGVLYVVAVLVATGAMVRIAVLSLSAFLRRLPEPDRQRGEREILPLARKVLGLVIAAIGVIIAFHHFGIDVTAIIATLGVGGLAIGFAAKETLSNMIAGFTLLLDRPFRLGDRIRLATGEIGDVVDVGIRTTRIRTPEAHLLVVPNAELTNSRITNFTLPTRRGTASVAVRMPMSADLGIAERLMSESVQGISAITEAPKILLTRITDGTVELTMTCVLADFADQNTVEDKLWREILRRFAQAKLAMARPHMEVAVTERR